MKQIYKWVITQISWQWVSHHKTSNREEHADCI